MIQRILVATDFSRVASHAITVAARLAKQLDAELVLLHAWYVPSSAYHGTFVLPDHLFAGVEEDARRNLAESVESARSAGARAAGKLVRGVAWTSIVDALSKESFDLCVVGTQGRSGLSRFLLGSVAENVIRHSPVSVLAIRPDADLERISHVLCPTDFSSSADHAVDLASQLVQPGGKITLLHVIGLPLGTRGEVTQPVVDLLDQDASAALVDRAGRVGNAHHAVETRSRVGPAGAEILAAIEEDVSVDLVVMGSHGRTGLARALLGSVAEKVVRYAGCPVLVARARAPS